MNTSASTNQSGFLRRVTAGGLLAAAIAATGISLAATSHADFGAPAPDLAGPPHAGTVCKTEPWGFLGSQRRTLCDGPAAGDGSWSRERTIWAPAHYSTPSCYTSGGGSRDYSRTNCSGGYWVNERLVSNETYPVRPDTVLPDEPGHLG